MRSGGIRGFITRLAAAFFGSLILLAQTSNEWIEQLRSPDAKTRAKAARELGNSGDVSVVPALAAALSDLSPRVRREVILALWQIRQPESLHALVPTTGDTDPGIRVLGIRAVVGYYTGEEPTTGFTGFWKNAWRRARSRFGEENLRIDPGITVEPKVVSALVAALNDTTSIEPARRAATGLGVLVAQPAVPELVKAAHSPDEELALEALNALAKIKDGSAGPQLVDLLDSANQEVRQEAAITVGILLAGDALPKLQAMYENDRDQETRKRALEGLAYLGDRVSVPIFVKALWSDDEEIRTLAAEGLARAADPGTLPELEKAATSEQDGGARLAKQYAITALGKDDYLSVLVEELGSRRRGESAQAYLVEASRNPKFLPKLYPYLNSPDPTLRRRLCTVLMFTGNQASLEHLERLSHDPKGEVASEALRAMRAIRVRLAAGGGRAQL